jgi:transposase
VIFRLYALKKLNDLNRIIHKTQELAAKQSYWTKARFVKKISKEKIELNTALIEKRRLLLRIKGCCTDLTELQVSNEFIIARNHHLENVEQSFRMSKFDLQSRLIYHQKEDAIRYYVHICFVALMIEKYLELTTKLSLREIRFTVWNITEKLIQDMFTKEIFVFRPPTKQIMKSPSVDLITKWNLLRH